MNNTQINEEIDLIHLFKTLLNYWKPIIACMLICLLLGSGYCVFQNSKTNVAIDIANANLNKKAEKEVQVESVIETVKKLSEGTSMDDAAREKLVNAVNIYGILDEYYTQLASAGQDASYANGASQVIQYAVASDYVARPAAKALVNYASNGGLTSALIADGVECDEDILLKRIAVDSDVNNTPSANEPTVVSVTVTCVGTNDKDAKELAKAVDQKLSAYATKLTTMGNVALNKVDQYKGEIDITVYNNKYQQIVSTVNNLNSQFNSFTSNFTDDQKAVFNAVFGKNIFTTNTSLSGAAKVEVPHVPMTAGLVKYAGVGAFGGLFIAVCFFACLYIFGGKLKQFSDLEKYYNYYIFGNVTAQSAGLEMLYANLKAICQKNNANKVCLQSSLVLSDATKSQVDSLIAAMKAQGVEVSFIGNALKDVAGFESMVDTGLVVLLEREMETKLCDISKLSDDCNEHGVKILGVIGC